jgi:MFS family permease
MARPEGLPGEGSGEGERRERAARRKVLTIKAALFVAGMATGAYVGWVFAERGIAAPWSPLAALLIAGVYLAAMLIGSVVMSRNLDEHERHRNYKTIAAGSAVYSLTYPVWFVLWKGGFVVEPIHWVLFLLFWAGLAAAALWYRVR